ncbi:MAG: bacterioferritin [Alphaproteobacteria bacterium]|nr:bacterioferritin [Alphaproteobacteria bacterium]
MKGAKDVIAELNRTLTNELTAINQYFLHARMYESWGFGKLGKKTYEESIGEMKHADKLVKRVLLLEGLPNLSDLHKLVLGETVPECLAGDLSVERRGREGLIKGIELCENKKDYVSRDLLREILEDTEEHIDYLETQLELIEAMGLQNYLQSQAQ